MSSSAVHSNANATSTRVARRAARLLPILAIVVAIGYVTVLRDVTVGGRPDATSGATKSAAPYRAPASARAAPVERIPAATLRDRHSSQWRAPECDTRQIVELTLPLAPANGESLLPLGHPKEPSTASCRLVARPKGDVRVFRKTGEEVTSRLEPVAGLRDVEVVFELAGSRRDHYEVYYVAGPDGPLPAPTGPRARGGVTLSVHAITGPQAKEANRLDQLVRILKDAKRVGGEKRRQQVDDCVNPFGRSDNYIAMYQGWLVCPVKGLYTFGIDADDRAALIVDGKRVIEGGAPGKLPSTPFQTRMPWRLDAGLHAMTFYHVQGSGALRARLAWKVPGVAPLDIIPPSAFARHMPTRIASLERKGADACEVFFEATPARRLSVNRVVPVTEWVLRATGPKNATAGGAKPSWVWREGDRELASGDQLRAFSTGAAGRTITLSLEAGGKTVASHTRTVPSFEGDPLEDDGIRFRFEFVSTPNFVYPHEPFEINIVALNESEEKVDLQVVERAYDRSGAITGEARPDPFTLPAFAGGGDLIARRMNRITRRFPRRFVEDLSRLTFTVGPPGAPTDELELLVVPSRSESLPAVRARFGALTVVPSPKPKSPYRQPSRAMVVMPYDTESDLRRWAFLKDLSKTTARGSEGALLFGDPLISPGARGGDGLAAGMRASLESDGIPFTIREVRGDDYPILDAVATIDKELRARSWERVWISLGGKDSRMGTPLVDYRRGLDLMIDRTRTLAPTARLVVIGPPPEIGRERTSEAYAEAARAICKQHAAPLVDLHALILAREDPSLIYREMGADDGTRFAYPVGAPMDEIAELVLEH